MSEKWIHPGYPDPDFMVDFDDENGPSVVVECHDGSRMWITLDCLRRMVEAVERP